MVVLCDDIGHQMSETHMVTGKWLTTASGMFFLPEASFGLWVLSSPVSVWVCVSVCVCESVCQSLACPRDNSGPVQARIAKFGPKIKFKSQNLLHVELVRTITHYPFELGSPNLDHRWRIAWLRSLLFLVAIGLDLQGQILFKKNNFLVSPPLEIHNHHITTTEPWVPRLLHRPDCFMFSVIFAYLYT